MSRRERSASYRIVRALLFTGGAIALAVALGQAWDRQERLDLFPGWWRLFVALSMLMAAFRLTGTAWLILLGERRNRGPHLRSLYVSQLGKYLPGGVWQPLSLIALTSEAGLGAAQGSTALAALTVTAVISAALLAVPLGLVASELPSVARWVPLLGLGAIPLVWRDWTERSLRYLAHRVKRFELGGFIPNQAAILKSVLVAMAALVLQGLALATLLSGTAPAPPALLASVPAFAAAWLLGFLALPIPGGLGLREAVLVAVLAPGVGGPPVLAAAVAHRVASIVAELLLMGATSFPYYCRRARRCSGSLVDSGHDPIV